MTKPTLRNFENMTEKAMKNKALVVIDIQNDITKHYRDIVGNINAAIEWAVAEGMHIVYIKHNNVTAATRTFKPGTKGEELAPEMKVVSDNISTCFNMAKAGFTVHVLSDCVTSYDLKKLPDMLAYYENKGCEVKTLADYKR